MSSEIKAIPISVTVFVDAVVRIKKASGFLANFTTKFDSRKPLSLNPCVRNFNIRFGKQAIIIKEVLRNALSGPKFPFVPP